MNSKGFPLLGFGLIGCCALVYLCGWHIPLMEIDAVQYANMSREMLHSGKFLELHDRGKDYLDKPPMLFWLGALSMKVFGVSDGAYRLPSFLFALLAILSTYKLARLYYSDQIAWLSAIVLASCEALFLINHDVRTDTMLMGWVIFTVWQLAAWYQNGAWKHWLLAAAALAGGMMTKGPIALMVPVFAFGAHFLLHREFRQILRWQYIPLLMLTGILLIPMCIGLYRQYDLHPGKVIDGLTIHSGLRFFFWTQSFGRVTGESQWRENDSFFFLFQNMLWSFLPWIIFFGIGLCRDLGQLWKQRFKLFPQQEWISTGGFVVTYCALGISHYQLPHYIYVVFPFAAIIAAKAFYAIFFAGEAGNGAQDAPKSRKPLFIIHVVIYSLLWIALVVLLYIPFPQLSLFIKIGAVAGAAVFAILLKRLPKTLPRLLILSVYTMAGVNFFLALGFYPALLNYQLHAVVMKGMDLEHIAPEKLYVYHMDEERALDFYTDHLYIHVNHPDSLSSGYYILTNQEGLDSIQAAPEAGSAWDLIYRGSYFHVSTLDLPFLNPATRQTELKPVYILKHP
jgi:4-amino-4-deoxy-L-arabinose transferase-like glycosyltransferase